MLKAVGPIDILVLEPDKATRFALMAVLGSSGYSALSANDEDEVAALVEDHSPSCALLDLSQLTASNIGRLRALSADLQVVVTSGSAEISVIVAAIKSGASDFLKKPFDFGLVLTSVQRALSEGRRRREAPLSPAVSTATTQLGLLTSRESEVLVEVAKGSSSKEVGRQLGISPRTVDVHRAHIMEKLHVSRTIDLLRLVYGPTSLRDSRRIG
jgi:FixJ family two-component response regulator